MHFSRSGRLLPRSTRWSLWMIVQNNTLLPALMARERRFVELRGYRSWPSNKYLRLCYSVSRAQLGMRSLSLTPLEKSRTACQDDTCFAVAFSSLLPGMRNCENVLSGGSHRRACCSLLASEGFLLTKPRSCRGTSFMFSHSVFAGQVDVCSRRFLRVRNCMPLIFLQPSGAVTRRDDERIHVSYLAFPNTYDHQTFMSVTTYVEGMQKHM